MKKITIKVTNGKAIEEVIELRNGNVDAIFAKVKDVIIAQMMDDNIEKRDDKPEPIIGDTDGDRTSGILEESRPQPIPREWAEKAVLQNSGEAINEESLGTVGEWESRLSEDNAVITTMPNVSKQEAEAVITKACDNVQVKRVSQDEVKPVSPEFLKQWDNAIGKAVKAKEEHKKPVSAWGYRTDFFLIAKCPKCSKPVFYKTSVGNTYQCNCGHEEKVDNVVKIVGSCPNCLNNVGSIGFHHKVGTLSSMDVSDIMNCKKCQSPLSMSYIEKKNVWKIM